MRSKASLWMAGAGAALLAATAAQAAGAKADLVILHGHVYAADGKPGFKEAVAIKGDRIVKVGSDAEVAPLAGPATRIIDAHGHTVIPGIIDNHVHMLAGAEGQEGVSLRGIRTAEALQAAIRGYLAKRPDVAWIRGDGYYGGFTRKDLDAVTGGKPALFMAGDGHSVLANTKALQIAGITKDTSAPAGGEIVRDADGELTGVFRESAQGVMEAALPRPTDADVMRLLAEATETAHKAGVTTIVNLANPADIAIYDRARAAGQLHLRLYNGLWLTPVMTGGVKSGLDFPEVFTFTEKDADDFDAIRRKYRSDDLMSVRMVKIMVDGVIESHTAAMLAPWADQPGTGAANYTPAELDRVIAMMDRRGWHIMTHALGDRAVRMALDAYQNAFAANPAPPQGRRDKIEHIESIDPADIPRFGQLGVIASVQPAHAGGMNDPDHKAARWRYLGYERSAWGFPWKSIKDAGGRLAFGSDWPVASLNAGRAMSVALNRRLNPPVPDQRLTVAELIDGYTRDSAYTIFKDKELGSLEPGKLADVVVLADDIFANPPTSGADLVVDETVFDGKVVYARDAPIN